MPADLEVGPVVPNEEARVYVGRHDLSVRPDSGRQPARDRPVARPDLQAPPARLDPELLQAPGRDGVEQVAEQPQTLALDGPRATRGEVAIVTHEIPPCPERPRGWSNAPLTCRLTNLDTGRVRLHR